MVPVTHHTTIVQISDFLFSFLDSPPKEWFRELNHVPEFRV
jgi:hypothetical protein